MASYYPHTHALWNSLAAAYEEKFMDLHLYNNSYDAFCAALKTPHPRVLEIGCGPGNISKYLLQKLPTMHLLGTDVAPAMIEAARKNVPLATFEPLDCRNIASLNQQFDGIVCGFCIPYITPSDCQKLIADCNALLAADGVLYISFVAGESHQSGEKINSRGESMHFEYYPENLLLQWLSNFGFEINAIIRVPYGTTDTLQEIHTILLARKKHVA